MKTKKPNLLVISFSMIFLLLYITREKSLGELVKILTDASFFWMAGALLMMIVYWLLEAGILHLSVRSFHPKQFFTDSLKTSMIGQFFNCVTPFSSGGQPMQAYHMVKTGVPLGSASCSLMVKFIVYQFVLTLYSALTLFFRFKMFSAKITSLSFLILTGFTVNSLVILGLLCICFFSGKTEQFLLWAVNFLAKIKLVKDPEKTKEYIVNELKSFYEGFQRIRANPKLILQMSWLSVVQLTSYFMIPYFIFKAFRLGEVSILSMISAEAFVLNISSFVPLPGAAGGAELSFYTMFALFFPANLLELTVFLWRMFTFYLPICVGMVFVMRFSKADKIPVKQCTKVSSFKPINQLSSRKEEC